MLTTVVEGDQKALFSIATTPTCHRGRYSFPWIPPLYPWYIPHFAESEAMRYQVPFLKSLLWHDQALNPGLPDHWRSLCFHFDSMNILIFFNLSLILTIFQFCLISTILWDSITLTSSFIRVFFYTFTAFKFLFGSFI